MTPHNWQYDSTVRFKSGEICIFNKCSKCGLIFVDTDVKSLNSMKFPDDKENSMLFNCDLAVIANIHGS